MGLAEDRGGTDLTVNSLLVGASGPGQAGTSITTVDNATTVNVGASGTAGTLNVFPATASKGKFVVTATNNTGNTLTTLTNAAMGQATVLSIPDPGAATANVLLDTATVPATFAAGTTSKAPITLTAGTNLTAAAAGAVEFDGTAFYATSTASSRQQVDAEQFTILASDFPLTVSASAQKAFNASSTGAITLVSGKTYAFEAAYTVADSGGTGAVSRSMGILFGGTASLTSIAYSVNGVTQTSANTPITGGVGGFVNVATVVTAAPANTGNTLFYNININGVLTINSGGTLIPQIQQSANNTGGTPALAMKTGSFFRIWEMAGTGTVGNWS